MELRPTLKVALTPADKLLEGLALLSLAVLWLMIFVKISDLPDRIPIHYNAAGQIDRYGEKSTIFILPVVATLLFIGMSFLNRLPHLFNYPIGITSDNAAGQYLNATRTIRYLKLAITVIFSIIVFMTIQNAEKKADGLGAWFMPVTMGLLFVPLSYFIFKSFRLGNTKPKV